MRVLVRDAREHVHVRVLRLRARDELAEDAALAHAGLADHDGERDRLLVERLVGQLLELLDRGGAARELRPQVVRRRGRDDRPLAFALAEAMSPSSLGSNVGVGSVPCASCIEGRVPGEGVCRSQVSGAIADPPAPRGAT